MDKNGDLALVSNVQVSIDVIGVMKTIKSARSETYDAFLRHLLDVHREHCKDPQCAVLKDVVKI